MKILRFVFNSFIVNSMTPGSALIKVCGRQHFSHRYEIGRDKTVKHYVVLPDIKGSSMSTPLQLNLLANNKCSMCSVMNQVKMDAGTRIDDVEADMSNQALLKQAEAFQSEERLFEAANCLKKISSSNLLSDKHRRVLEHAEAALALKNDLLAPNPAKSGWIKQKEFHGKSDTTLWYKINQDNTIVRRIEMCIESSLVSPFLSVLNESELYQSWTPRYTFPVKVGFSECVGLRRWGRFGQVLRLRIDMPFPLSNRELIQHSFLVDSIDEDNAIILHAKSMNTGKYYKLDVPKVDKGYKRIDILSGIVIRPCPDSHTFHMLKNKNPNSEKLMLISISEQINPHLSAVPLKLVNFFQRTILGQQWGLLIKVAEEVRDGKRPEFKRLMNKNVELYSWVDQRVQVMLDKMM